jgi:DNA-binding beta-propeller fold protein YncE
LALAAVLTVRSAARLAYINYDLATELLVYAHGTPDIKVARAEIKLISERVAGGYGIEVAYDDASTWPLIWYLRDYPNARYYGTEPTPAAMAAPIIIVGPKNADKVWPFVARGYIRRDYRLVWWPLQGYTSAGWGEVIRAVTDPATRQQLWQFALRRRLPWLEQQEWPNGQRFAMYVSRDLAQQVWSLEPPTQDATSESPGGPVPTREARLVEIYADVYGGMPLRGPTAIASAPDGARVIADAGNDRVVVLDRDGRFRLAFGGRCRLTEQPPAGCRDPDGSGPLELGDGQFHEPWGIAVDARGAIYVADTWNGRIQVFDAAGRFLRRWGRFGHAASADPSATPLTLYGPRGVAIEADGNVLVADTGNKRILRFSPQGEPLQQVGGGGRNPGRFSEPVGVAAGAADGSVWVTDTWNRRIQSFDRRLEPAGQWPVPGWEGRGALNKPYLTVAPSGVVYAGDPERSRIYVFGAGGRLDVAIKLVPSGPDGSLPLGLAIDPVDGSFLVADRRKDRVIAIRP